MIGINRVFQKFHSLVNLSDWMTTEKVKLLTLGIRIRIGGKGFYELVPVDCLDHRAEADENVLVDPCQVTGECIHVVVKLCFGSLVIVDPLSCNDDVVDDVDKYDWIHSSSLVVVNNLSEPKDSHRSDRTARTKFTPLNV